MNQQVYEITQNIFKEAQKGDVVLRTKTPGAHWHYKVHFLTDIGENRTISDGNYPILKVPNMETLIDEIERYLVFAEPFYRFQQNFFDLGDKSYRKKLIFDLFVSASPIDFENFIPYINHRKQFLTNNFKSNKRIVGQLEDSNIIVQINKSASNLEAPYRFSISFSDEFYDFVLPQINFGVDDKGIVNVFSIQNKKGKQENPLAKRLDRKFRSVNKGVDSEDEISKVSPNALVALTIFTQFFNNFGFTDFLAVPYMPLRYDSHITSRINNHSSEEAEIEADRIQYNVTNKFLNTFARYQYHFSNSTFTFDDITENAKLVLPKKKKQYTGDNLIYQIANSISYNEILEREMER